jgi:hypothetical protein
MDDTVILESIGCQLTLRDVYEKVEMPHAFARARFRRNDELSPNHHDRLGP